MTDPIKTAAKRVLPKRFYKLAHVEKSPEGQFRILLDNRPVRTPAKAELQLPSQALAEAVAAEWEAQGEYVDPATMPLTRIANSTIDGVVARRADVELEMANYACNDLVCYRAETPQALVQRQAEAWDPVVAWAAKNLGVEPRIARGIMHVAQPPELAQAVKNALSARQPLHLAALHVITTLTGSALLALAHADGLLEPDALWKAAHIDEDFQIEQWGWDAEAEARRSFRHNELIAAARVLALLRA